MRILGVSGGFGHDAAAALVVDGRLVHALEEERCTRIREAPWSIPIGAIQEALAVEGCPISDVDVVAISWDPELFTDEPRPGRLLEDLVETLRDRLGHCPPVAVVPHHLSHAAAGYLTSDFDDAAVVVLDDRGEQQSGTIFRAHGTRLDESTRVPIRASLGAMYTAATRHIGFGSNQAGKTMGLAAFGEVIDDLPHLRTTPDGYRFVSDHVSGCWDDDHFPDWSNIFTDRFGPARPSRCAAPNGLDDIPAHHRDLAASVQAALERIVCHLVEVAVSATGSHSVVLAGGVALNCTTNGRVRALDVVEELHVFGAAGDAGGAVGAALWLAAECGEPRHGWHPTMAFGTDFATGDVADRARQLGLAVECGDPSAFAAAALLRGRTGGWFRGPDEFGPRALGNRSIIARADDPAIASRVNMTKGREPWRPLAPALDLNAARRLGIAMPAHGCDFMIEARWPERTPALAGATHADGSTRPLVVHHAEHPFAPVLAALDRRGALPVILNTSFNVAGEPLVHTPLDAFRTFCASDLDFLCFEDLTIAKPERPS